MPAPPAPEPGGLIRRSGACASPSHAADWGPPGQEHRLCAGRRQRSGAVEIDGSTLAGLQRTRHRGFPAVGGRVASGPAEPVAADGGHPIALANPPASNVHEPFGLFTQAWDTQTWRRHRRSQHCTGGPRAADRRHAANGPCRRILAEGAVLAPKAQHRELPGSSIINQSVMKASHNQNTLLSTKPSCQEDG